MINSKMRLYNYYLYSNKLNEYAQPELSEDAQGTIKMNINIVSQSNNDDIRYSNSSYVGLTLADINDKFVIDYDGRKLKVLYINPLGRYKQVFLGDM